MDVVISLIPDSTTLNVDGTQALTAAILPSNTTDKTVKWSVGGNAVKLYSDETCNTPVTLNTATSALTVYAKGVAAGSATVTVTSNADSNKSASCDFTINKATPVVTAPTEKSLTYNTQPQTLVTQGSTTGGTLLYSLDGVNYSANVPTATNAGTYTVYYKVQGNSNYCDLAAQTVAVTINKAPINPTITVAGWTYNGATPDEPAVVTGNTGNGDVTYLYTGTSYGGVAYSADVPPTDAGEYTVTATVAQTANYNGATTATADFTVAKKSATVTADAKSKTYGDTDPELTATVTGTVGSETLNYTLSRAAGDNVGDYAITVTLGSNPNYSVTPTNGTFTINRKAATVTADAKSKIYGDDDPTLTATVTGTVGEETLNYSLARAEGENVGDYGITVTLGSNPNYDVTPTNNTFTINQKAATVTADAKSKYYGDADPELTAVVAGTVGSDTLSYTLSRAAGDNVGGYAITVTLGSNPNYNVTKTDSTLTINKKPAPASLTNDQKPTPVEGLSETGGQHGLVDGPEHPLPGYTPEYSIDGGTSWGPEIPTAKEKGTYTVKVRYKEDNNHEPYSGMDELTVTIGKQEDDIVLNSPTTDVKLTIDNRTGSTMKNILDDAKDAGSVSVTDDGSQTTTVTVEVSIELNVELEQNAANIGDATGTTEETAYKASQIAEVYDVSLQKITTTTTVVTNNSDGFLISKDTASGAPVPVPYSGGSIMITIPFVKSNPSAAYSVVYYDGAGNYEDMHANYDETAKAFSFYTSHTSTYFVYEESVTAEKVSEAYELVLKPSGTDGRTYDIILNATDGKIINRFTAADLTFSLTGTTGHIVYDVAPNAAAYIKLNDAESGDGRYEFYVDGVDYSGVSGSSITLGTVTFGGYGSNWAFRIDSAVVNTTKFNDNVVVTTEGTASATVGSMVYTDKDTNTNPYTAKIDPLTLNPDTKNLTVNVTFPNGIQDNASAYQDMTLTVSGGDLTQEIVVKLGQTASIADITPNAYPYGKDAKTTATVLQTGDYNYGAATLTADRYTVTLTQILTLNTMYTVTVSGAGYRTARYNVLMDDNKTLTFWNNVMDAATVVETEKDSSAVQVTYLAGDIVQDAQINVYDLSAVVSYFGDTNAVDAASPYAKYDLNRDGKIDSIDVAYVLVSWGK